MRKLFAALALLVGLAPALAEEVSVGPAGGATAAGVIIACGASNGQLLYDASGSCAGTAGLTWAPAGVNQAELQVTGARSGTGQGVGNISVYNTSSAGSDTRMFIFSAFYEGSNSGAGQFYANTGGNLVDVLSVRGKSGNVGVELASTMVLGWGSGASSTTDFDTGLSRVSAGVVGVGTGAAASVAGTLKAAIAQLALSNTDTTNTNGAGSVIYLTNSSATGQTVITSYINSTLVAKWRTDYVGGINWVSNGGSGNHSFWTGGDSGSGNVRLQINNNNTILMSSSQSLGWTNTDGSAGLASGGDTFIVRAAAGVLNMENNVQINSNAYLSSPASTTIQHGLADAAVAVAQTLRVQSVVAGTAAANGANFTIIGSLPTGTGTSGDIIFQTGVKTGSGTTQGTATTALTIKGETQVVNVASAGSAAAPSLAIGNSTTGLYSVSTTGFATSINGTSKLDYGITIASNWYTPTTIWSDGGFALRSNASLFLLQDTNSAHGVIIEGSDTGGSTPYSMLLAQSGTSNFVRFTPISSGVLQFGGADFSSATAQTTRVQSIVAGTSATNGANWTLIGSLSTGTGTSGDIIIQTGVAPGSGTNQATATTAVTIKGESGEVRLPRIATDSGKTDATVCEDTTNHGLFFGSGTAGVCLGTSGRQFKTDFAPMTAGLDEIMRLPVQSYRYLPGYGDNGARRQFGLVAQDVEHVMPSLAGHNAQGETINYDWAALLFVAIRAIQELKADNDNLRTEIRRAASR